MTESQLAALLEGTGKRPGLLGLGGWTWTHFRPAQSLKGWRTPLSGDKGFPDYVCVRETFPFSQDRTVPDYELIFIELKGDGGKVSAEQKVWHDLLRKAGQRMYVWWPEDFEEAKAVLL